jgi:Na+/phosphate symporter
MVKNKPVVKLKQSPLLVRFASSLIRGALRLLTLVASLWLFILAISFMKEGAHDLVPLIQGTFSISGSVNNLGFGWLLAYITMSGSPVAAIALTFYDAGAISDIGAFNMITGSRLGASLIVLVIGFVYMLRGKGRAESLGIGILSLLVTGTTYLCALGIGYWFLQYGLLDGVQIQGGMVLSSFIDGYFTPIVTLAAGFLPGWLVFLAGLLILLLSFRLIDSFLPTESLRQSQLGRVSRLIYRPVVMLLLGMLVTLVSMSVSVSISILVPLSNRGFVRRENVIPYIMGANITTFIDTLLASVLLQNPRAFTVVVVEMVSVAIVSSIILLFFYSRYERAILSLVNRLVASNLSLALFIIFIFVTPLILLRL